MPPIDDAEEKLYGGELWAELAPEERRRLVEGMLEKHPLFHRMPEEDRVPPGVTEVVLGRWIGGSRRSRD